MNMYVSCIKILGQPILPPLMTDDIRSEMTYYKQLAIAVEEKISRASLSSLEASPENLNDNSTSSISKETRTEKIFHKNCIPDDDTRPTDINKYPSYRSHSLKTELEASKMTSEFAKSQVPTSLDIVPITLNKPQRRKHKSFSDIDDCVTEPATLVRQGSYTLETPSSMLLAHLDNSKDCQNNFQDELNFYTPTFLKNKQKRKEWNITQALNNWTVKNKKSIYREIKSENDSIPQKKTSLNNFIDENSLIVVGKSVNCIQHILSKDTTLKETSKQHKLIDSEHNSFETASSIENQDIDRTQLVGSLETLSGNENILFKNKQLVTDRMTKSLDISSFNNDNSKRSTKRGLTSQRLLHVFEEIQKTHEKQMVELVQRQKQEQVLMQKTFEKQQLMLLDQIDKTFPGISVQKIVGELAENNKEFNERFINNKQMIYNGNLNVCESNLDNQVSEFACQSGNESTTFNGSSFNSDGKSSIGVNLSGEKENINNPNSNERRRPSSSRQLFPLTSQSNRVDTGSLHYNQKHVQAATIINAYAKGYLVRRLMKTERVVALKNTYKEALHYMLKLHIDAPLELPELEFHQRLQLQCDASSINMVELFSQSPAKRMKIISNDRQIQQAKMERSTSARSSISFATQQTLARKKLREIRMNCQLPNTARSTIRSRCQTWTSNSREKRSPCVISTGIKRSTSAGAVRKPWR
ncbi:uncharacterized protein LOC122857528 [Aphidius gifuensis]|uniref:uncharacterized protein LOC122857528 n=1 Tax=Aphidius gifuensis TaxID=684658 RepID=UPI001CDC8836|nr:uncharacterized protein LOC122857528 [Aphidius gifuensis]XP_044015672.1 uncharacterized protein LOC122857528 [Aphidius gifuensis]XP_044015673.1 uncharacterized protein LOC122857528 [Aphidius gifuensis]XP_044015674.1 uncharacterized protein LOC122857528 [Aphidius gifuensis]